MTYKEIKEFLATLTEDQLSQKAIVFIGDHEIGDEIQSIDISQEDIYWDHGDCLGNEEEAKEFTGDDLEDYTKVPAGTVTIQAE